MTYTVSYEAGLQRTRGGWLALLHRCKRAGDSFYQQGNASLAIQAYRQVADTTIHLIRYGWVGRGHSGQWLVIPGVMTAADLRELLPLAALANLHLAACYL